MSLLLGLISTDLEWLLGKHCVPPQEDKAGWFSLWLGEKQSPSTSSETSSLLILCYYCGQATWDLTFCLVLHYICYLINKPFLHKWSWVWLRQVMQMRNKWMWGSGLPGSRTVQGCSPKHGELCGRTGLATSTGKRQTQVSAELFKLSFLASSESPEFPALTAGAYLTTRNMKK